MFMIKRGLQIIMCLKSIHECYWKTIGVLARLSITETCYYILDQIPNKALAA